MSNLPRRILSCMALVLVIFGQVRSSAFAEQAPVGDKSKGVPITGRAQWQAGGLPVVAADGSQRAPQIVTDGAGGGIVVWQDNRPYDYPDAPRYLYTQRVSAAGQSLWEHDGIAVALLGAVDPQLVSDGHGGAIVAWYGSGSSGANVFVQRLAPDGALVWGAGGLALSMGAQPASPRIAADGAGGAFVVWRDDHQNGRPSVRIQHVLADGVIAWATGGLAVASNVKHFAAPQVMFDESDGAFVIWQGDSFGRQAISVQRVRSDGALAWGEDGVLLSIATEFDAQAQLLTDGAGGVTVVWVDGRALNDDIYAQRVDADGKALWASGGLALVTEAGDQVSPRIIDDGAGGMILAWHDTRAIQPNVLLQRLGGDGRKLWNAGGVPVASQPLKAQRDDERHFDLISDRAGGAMVTWIKGFGPPDNPIDAVWVQRVSAAGDALWPDGGVIVATDPYWYGLGAPRLLALGKADVIVVWEDNRRWWKTDAYDVYAQRVIEGSHRTFLPVLAKY